MSSFENFVIPLEEIHLATQNFSSENRIGDGGFGMVYKGKLSERWQNRAAAIKRLNRDGYQGKPEFFNELELVSSFHHHNIIPFIGYCNEGDEMIIVFEYAVKGSLETHLQDRNKRRCLTWEQRLKICLGTARGLQYLHSGRDHFKFIIHRDMKSANILLDENLEAKICDFGLSRSSLRNDPNSKFYTKVAGTEVYTDPDYRRSGKLSKEVDVYSFGIVMFELMTGLLAYYRRRIDDKEPKNLIPLVLEYGDRPYKISDPDIRHEIDDEFFHTFNELANKCINLDPRQRPTMDTIITKIEEHLQAVADLGIHKREVQLRREQRELDAERMEVFAHLEKIANKVKQEKHNVDELLKQRYSIQSSFTVARSVVVVSNEGASDSKSKKKWFNLNLKGSSDKKSG